MSEWSQSDAFLDRTVDAVAALYGGLDERDLFEHEHRVGMARVPRFLLFVDLLFIIVLCYHISGCWQLGCLKANRTWSRRRRFALGSRCEPCAVCHSLMLFLLQVESGDAHFLRRIEAMLADAKV